MTRAPQKRRVKTRDRMLTVAREIVTSQGFAALRVEDVVAGAEVAKGTFFSHFKDKDGILVVLVSDMLSDHLDQMAQRSPPESLDDVMEALTPLVRFLAGDGIVFQIFLNYSGAIQETAHEAIGQAFYRMSEIFTGWTTHMIARGLVRQDVEPARLAEGIVAFKTHVVALQHCMNVTDPEKSLTELAPFLQEWLVVR